jgi:MFS transporter, DHA1 family, multidrug resistance protein
MKFLVPHTFAYTLFLSAAVAIGPLSTDMYLPTLPQLEQVFAANISEITWTLTAFMIGLAGFQLIIGPVSDRFGRKTVLMGGLTIFALSCFAVLIISTTEELILLRVIQSFGVCTAVVIPRAMVRDLYERDQAARQLSRMGTIMGIAPVVAPVLGGFIAVTINWQAIFVVLGIYALILLVIIHFMVEDSLKSRDHMALKLQRIFRNYMALLQHREYLGYVLTATFSFAGFFAYISASSFILIEVMGVKVAHFGFYFGSVVLGFISGTLLGPKLTYLYNLRRSLQVGCSITLVGGMILLTLGLSDVVHPLAIIIPIAIYDMGVGIVMPQCQAAAMHPFPEKAGAASALSGFTILGVSGLLGLLVATLYDHTQMPLVWTVAVMSILTFTFFHVTVFRDKSEN